LLHRPPMSTYLPYTTLFRSDLDSILISELIKERFNCSSSPKFTFSIFDPCNVISIDFNDSLSATLKDQGELMTSSFNESSRVDRLLKLKFSKEICSKSAAYR